MICYYKDKFKRVLMNRVVQNPTGFCAHSVKVLTEERIAVAMTAPSPAWSAAERGVPRNKEIEPRQR